MELRRILAKNYINAIGWRTRRKIILIESDDWGAIRMPSRKIYEKLLTKNIQVDKSYFDKYDSLESSEDLNCLFDILSSFKDKNGEPAVITAFTVVANPDFDKIEACNKQEYHYELITETYKRSAHTEKSFELFKEGAEKRLFYPQSHGREHINIKRWIEAINSNSLKEQIAFDERAIISSKMLNSSNNYPFSYFAAFNYDIDANEIELVEVLEKGLKGFENLFGFKSISFVPPCGIWGDGINATSYNNGVKLVCGQQNIPIGNDKLIIKNKYWGNKNKYDQLYWRRNCTFEPARNHNYDWVSRCLKEIEIAFRWGKPAVINSHRVNFIGSIFPENRDQSLAQLKKLLTEIQKRWPEVEFMDTERLGNIMLNNNSGK